MSNIENKSNQRKRIVKQLLWVITILSFLFFIYKVVVFSTSVAYYDFELDQEVKPTRSMILIYSIGALIGASVLPIALWMIYVIFYFVKSDRYKRFISNLNTTKGNSTKGRFSTFVKSSNLRTKLSETTKNINPKTKNLIGITWILFHLFMLLTSNEIFEYRISWESFWFFNEWEGYGYRGNKYHYDISEFMFYVIIPFVIIYGRKYIKGEKILKFDLNTSTKNSTTDERINELKKYKELFDLGVISEEEFTEIKKKLL